MKLKYKYTKFVFAGDNYVEYKVISSKPKHFTAFCAGKMLGSIEFVGGTSSRTRAKLALERILQNVNQLTKGKP